MDPRRFSGRGNGKLEAFKFALYVSSELSPTLVG